MYNCCVNNCKTNTPTGEKGPVTTFPEFLTPPDKELSKQWERFVNRKNFVPTKYSRICLNHFDERFLETDGTTKTLLMNLKPVPTIHTDTETPKSLLSTVTVHRLPPRKRSFPTESSRCSKDVQSLGDLREEHCPEGFQFRSRHDCVVYFPLIFDENDVPQIKESIKINQNLNVTLSYEGAHIPLPQSLRSARNARIQSTNSLPDLVAHIGDRVANLPPILEELRSISFYKPTGRPPYSSSTLRYALLLRYTSRQAYSILLTQLPLPSFSLLAKLAQGSIDALKVAKVMLQQGKISADCVVIFDEMYLQKGTQFRGGEYVGADEAGNFYKGIVSFMLISLKKSTPLIVKALPECTISGKWLADETVQVLKNLAKIGMKVRAVIADNHSSNVSCFSLLTKKYGKKDCFFINFDGSKVYLFYDATHLIKNVRNNLFANKKFVFPGFEFYHFKDPVRVWGGSIQWGLLHSLYDKDQQQAAHLRKAHHLPYRALHPGNDKQSVPLALAIFHESTAAGIRSFFPRREDAASFLTVINMWWLICNSKERWHGNNYIGDAITQGDGRILFLNAFADWLETWSTSTKFGLTDQTKDALIRTTRCTAMLAQDLLDARYDLVLIGRFQCDPLERRHGCYRMMSGGRFLVGLAEVQNSEKIKIITSLLKAEVNFWDEDVYETSTPRETQMLKLMEEIAEISVEIYELCLKKESREIAVNVAGYIAMKINARVKCEDCEPFLICKNPEERSEIDGDYLKLLDRGGLTAPGKNLAEFVCHAFAVLDLVDDRIAKYDLLSVRRAGGSILSKYLDDLVSCSQHHDRVKRLAISQIINVFYNNKTKRVADQPRKDSIEVFKEKQLKKDEKSGKKGKKKTAKKVTKKGLKPATKKSGKAAKKKK